MLTQKDTTYAIIHALVVTPETLLVDATIVVRQGKIAYVGQHKDAVTKDLKLYDAKGKLVGPGLIDMHIHGAGTFDSTRGNIQENLEGLALFLQQKGITSFQLAIVMDLDLLFQIREALEKSSFLASHLLGIYAEGPFIAPKRRGGIPLMNIRAFEREYLDAILAIEFDGVPLVHTMTIAPELAGSEELSSILKEHNVVVAYGHSDCSLESIEPREKNHITHLFNAMSPINHKQPGLAAMPFIHSATYELVCDGVHVHPLMLHFVINTLGTSNFCLISDAMNVAGMGPGESTYLNRDIYCDGKACYYKDNNILIGSATLISASAKRLYKEGLLDKHSFFKVASENPARVLSLCDRGKIAFGYKADLVMLSEEMNIVQVFKAD